VDPKPDLAATEPLLSVVVAIVSDTTDGQASAAFLMDCLDALSRQVDPPPMEIIVPHHPYVQDIQAARARFPGVVFLEVDDLKHYSGQGGTREHHDELRARGLAGAHGQLVGLLEDHARPDEHWCRRVVDAHQQAFAGVGGAIENGVDKPLNWAVYFCDFGKYQNPLAPGETLFASDANIVYKRSALESIRDTWLESFHETIVNGTLRAAGQKLALSPEVIVYQQRGGLTFGQAVQERFVWGRSYAVSRVRSAGAGQRLVYAALAPVLPGVLLGRMTLMAVKKRRTLRAFARAFPLTALLTTSWSCGELAGYLSRQPTAVVKRTPTPSTSLTRHQSSTT
jgi:hypothetical protein